MKNPIMVALDVPTEEQAVTLIDILSGVVGGYKIGSALNIRFGDRLVRRAAKTRKEVFLDLKFNNTPDVVAAAVKAAAEIGATMCNMHIDNGPESLKAGADAAKQSGITLLGVTVLTTRDNNSLEVIGINRSVTGQVDRLARLAMEYGLQGLVASSKEVANLRSLCGPDCKLVIPGIRTEGDEAGDQKRIGTPVETLRAGADWLVIGSSIIKKSDPRKAAEEIWESIQQAELDAPC